MICDQLQHRSPTGHLPANGGIAEVSFSSRCLLLQLAAGAQGGCGQSED
jgi:hypothetical protein